MCVYIQETLFKQQIISASVVASAFPLMLSQTWKLEVMLPDIYLQYPARQSIATDLFQPLNLQPAAYIYTMADGI